MAYKCEIKEQPAQHTLCIRTRTPVKDLPQVLGQAYDEIAKYLWSLGEQPAGPPFVAYHNMEMQNLDVEVGFPVSKKIAGKVNIQAGELPAGKIATCIHVGPYNELAPAYTALTEWISANGYQVTGVAYEMYLNDPNQTPPQELMTQIVFPLQTR